MNEFKLIFVYSSRIVIRQWRRFVLPFLSLGITSTVLTLILLITASSTLLLDQQSRTLLGGDIVIEVTSPIDSDAFWKLAGVTPTTQSNQISFSATLKSDAATSPFSVQVVDKSFPLYGQLTLNQGTFTGVSEQEIYLDVAGANKLGVEVGDTVTFGSQSLIIGGIIKTEPTSLFGGFRFLPRAIMSQEGFYKSGVDPRLLRAEYVYAGAFSNLSKDAIDKVREAEEKFSQPIDVDIASTDERGLQFGLRAVSSFLVIAVLITSVLSAVNVYASTLYFISAERRNLAVLLALGLQKKSLTKLLGSSLGYVVVLSSVFGIAIGNLLYAALSSYIASTYTILLPTPNIVLYALVCLTLIIAVALASFIPAIAKTLSLNPKQILIGGETEKEQKRGLYSITLISLSTLLPLIVFASFLFRDIISGALSILAIGVLYVAIAGIFSLILSFFYKKRAQFSFFIRSIISQKKADGFFGIISFTSLFIALVSISSLALIQLSLEQYLTGDLARSVPTTYVLDVQPSQKDELTLKYPDLTLYGNIRARIIAIDSVRVQEELENKDSKIDRELGREYNLTARNDLLTNEEVTQGQWSNGKSGEISVDEDFAERANIRLGSKVVFSIQGFEIEGVVTSLRKTDSRSGLPFFFFVLSPQDVQAFPAVYFGYSYAGPDVQKELGQFVAREMPNVSILDTQAIGPQIAALIQTLLVLVLIVSLPPLLIATLLIATLVVSSYESRRREGARLRAIGATRMYVLKHYLVETVSLTLVSAVVAYALSMAISFGINIYFLKLNSTVLFDTELLIGLGLIVLSIGLIGYYLFRTDTMPLRELLSYESNL